MKSSYKKKLIFVVNVDWGFTNFRAPIATEAQKKGYEVHLITEVTNKYNSAEILKDLGIKVHNVEFKRGSENPLSLFRLLFNLINIFKSLEPDVVHLVTIKSVIIGGLAARITKINSVVIAISGLGFSFIDNSFSSKIRKFFLKHAYRIVLNCKKVILIFQNKDDAREILCINKNRDVIHHIIPGSGVDLNKFFWSQEDLKQKPKIIMVSRLLTHKGVLEYLEAAEEILQEGIEVDFELIGDIDPENPASLTNDQINEIKHTDVVKIRGHLLKVEEEIRNSNLVILPSYREGFPKVLIEAAACGRAIITTDVPGCRDAVKDGYNGLLVPPKNTEELINSIKYLIRNPQERVKMAFNNRKIAEERYSILEVVKTHINIYDKITGKVK